MDYIKLWWNWTSKRDFWSEVIFTTGWDVWRMRRAMVGSCLNFWQNRPCQANFVAFQHDAVARKIQMKLWNWETSFEVESVGKCGRVPKCKRHQKTLWVPKGHTFLLVDFSPVGEIHGCYENANGQPRYGRDDPDAKTFSFAPVDSPAVLTSMSNVLSKGNGILPYFTMLHNSQKRFTKGISKFGV